MNMASPSSERHEKLARLRSANTHKPLATTAMPTTLRHVSLSPRNHTDIKVPIRLIAVNGNTAAWLAGAQCKALNISKPNRGPASNDTASQTRQRARNPAASR